MYISYVNLHVYILLICVIGRGSIYVKKRDTVFVHILYTCVYYILYVHFGTHIAELPQSVVQTCVVAQFSTSCAGNHCSRPQYV